MEPGYKILQSDPFPLDMNFFKGEKEIKTAFKNFLFLKEENIVQGFFEL